MVSEIRTHLEVVAAVEVTGHAEVADLDGKPLTDETVACRQVSVDEM